MTPTEIHESAFRKDIDIMLDEYAGWFGQAVRNVFYPLQFTGKTLGKPEYFAGWIVEVEEKNLLEEATLNNLKKLHNDLVAHAKLLIDESVKFQSTPPYVEFNRLITFYEEFIHALKRVEKDNIAGQVGVDDVTGLRDAHMFFDDARLEMNRLLRQGKSFCVVVARIDQFDAIKNNLGPEEFNACIKAGAAVIKKSLRSFDDAYRLENGRFILSLKQTNLAGGVRSVMRIKKDLEENPFAYRVNGEAVKLSISGCVAEPVADENLGQLLLSMQKDLDDNPSKRAFALEYQELSPLQRYVKDQH